MPKINLDTKSFKALSAKSRVSILEKLTQRRMTLSELSKRLSLKNPTVKEHCNLLLEADLVTKIDEGRKWKYYELTNKGRQIVEPNMFNEIKSLVMLSFAAIIFTSFILFGPMFSPSMFGPAHSFDSELSIQNEFGVSSDALATKQVNIESDSLPKSIEQNNVDINIYNVDYNFFSISLIFSLLIGIFAGWIVAKKS